VGCGDGMSGALHADECMVVVLAGEAGGRLVCAAHAG
jgi:hypothetical protein